MGPPRVVAMMPANPEQRSLHRVFSAPLTNNETTLTPHAESETLLCCTLRRGHNHFFCPRNARNRELLDTELPSTDIVKKAKSIFESHRTTVRSPLWTDTGSMSSGVSSADLSSPAGKTESFITSSEEDNSDWEEEDSSDDVFDYPSSPPRYISSSVMDRIRSKGSSITYYGGKIVESNIKPISPTRIILNEIHRSTEYQAWLSPASGLPRKDFATVRSKKEVASGHCKLVKSNSCDSRLEIIALQSTSEQERKHGSSWINQQLGLNNNNHTHEMEHQRVRSLSTPGDRGSTLMQDTWNCPGTTSVVYDFCSRRHPSRHQPVPTLSQHPLFNAAAANNTHARHIANFSTL